MAGEAGKSSDRPACPQCGNRLRVLPDQMGTTVRCPKCNATFQLGGGAVGAVSAGAKPKPGAKPPGEASRKGPLEKSTAAKRAKIVPEARKPDLQPPPPPPSAVDDDEAYEPEIPLRPTFIVPEEPTAQLRSAAEQEATYDVDWSTADDLEAESPAVRPVVGEEMLLESAKRRGLIRDRYRPDPPRFTYFSGVFDFPWRGINLSRWITMSLGLAIAGPMWLATLDLLGFLGSGSANMILGVLLLLFTILITLLTLSFATASCQAAIQDTADGHEFPQDSNLADNWVLTFLAWLYLWAGAGALGYPLSLVIGPSAYLMTSALLFPVLLLSAMESDSFLLPFSPPILQSLASYLHGWGMFYVLAFLLAAGWIAICDLGTQWAPYLTLFATGPVLAAIMLIYARLLGRVAWRISGAPMAEVDVADDSVGRRAAEMPAGEPAPPGAKPGQRRRSKIRIEIPDESAADDETPPEPPPRINFHLRP